LITNHQNIKEGRSDPFVDQTSSLQFKGGEKNGPPLLEIMPVTTPGPSAAWQPSGFFLSAQLARTSMLTIVEVRNLPAQ
jgi:hypothetical protein